ncbi:5,10-methylenetetrahydrofolate reductase [Jatrophihabitans endophyticus]|uniref:Methylenetetrahydrofolate reductase n=1 Tax=Jatrophihabitans endophyticus TaxID=1206085 RepID=A0A1M5UGU8_9ACTN|nr:methylenetetrahydrofolate reductase [Jatrophihabitans endophyticus]SHH62150.1 5,10-methylenetetrahydrofolate reductase [Jatrophihabitans endophyticus]
MELTRRIREGAGEVLLFALTPPRLATATARVQEIADATIARLRGLDLDGLVLYDIDDEVERNPQQRPFPFVPTLDPADYLAAHLGDWTTPAVVYRAVGKYAPAELRSWLATQDPSRVLTVLVGAASSSLRPASTLTEAQAWARELNPELVVGGVAIPERHHRRGDEHVRMLAKQRAGCRFFVTQVVYDVNAAKNLVSDYFYACAERGTAPAPIVFTFSVCGSLRTLEFLEWLGVDVPRWIENDLTHAGDTVLASQHVALAAAVELIEFCRRLGMPFGVNVESVSIRRVEIEASVGLAGQLQAALAGGVGEDDAAQRAGRTTTDTG